LTEQELIHGLKTGSEDAFKELVESRQSLVFNTIIGFLQNHEDAEDVTQDVFIKVFESIQQFKGESALSTWIYRVAVTSALEFLRKKKRKKRFGFLTPIWNENNEPTVDVPDFHHPGVQLDNKEKAAMLFKAIRQLPENQQIAFILNKVESLSYQEVASIMQTSLSAVESLLHRAKSNLKEILKNFNNLDQDRNKSTN
jgi:RNA polymerase sigma factor (sigma-70 family)